MSGSGSQRTVLGIRKKYVVDLMTPGKDTINYANRVDTNAKKRYKSQCTVVKFKNRHINNKYLKRELKYENKTVEGTVYKSNR